MNKYVVIKILNSSLDACSIVSNDNCSGVCTCSTGDGTPWVLAESKPFNNREDAFAHWEKIFAMLLDKFCGEELNKGWEITYNDGGYIFVTHTDDKGDIDENIWVATISVLEIPEEDAI